MQISTHYYRYISIVIGVSICILFIYQIKYNSFALKNKNTSAGYLIQDESRQHHFNNGSLNAALALSDEGRNSTSPCPCSPKTSYAQLISHGEDAPVFVPDSMPIEPDIVDKLSLNAFSDGSVLITIAGYAIRKELYNWIKLLEYAEESKFVVFCTDDKLYMHMVIAGYEDQAVLIPDSWLMSDTELFRNTSLSLLDQPPRVSHVKTWVLQRLIYQPFDIMLLDVNQVMLHKRTLEYIQTLMHLRGDTKLIATQDSTDQHTVNTGLMLIRRNSQKVKRVVAQAVLLQEEHHDLTQQELFNMALNKTDLHVKTGMIVLLDILHFPNGHTHFIKNLPTSKGIEPFIIHLNHKFGEDRIALLKQHDLWPVNEEYINYLSYLTEESWNKRQHMLAEIEQNQL